ncbi:unnamed protein product, partial [Meganyctiphanes norvegica]
PQRDPISVLVTQKQSHREDLAPCPLVAMTTFSAHGILFLLMGAAAGVVANVQPSGIFTLDSIDYLQLSGLLEVAERTEPFSCWCSETQGPDDSCPVMVPATSQ